MISYTSWDRTDRETLVLVKEGGPAAYGRFSGNSAEISGTLWRLDVTKDLGASATLEDGRVMRIAGNLGRDKRLEASLDGRTFTFLNENGGNWIIEDVDESKVAQFSSKNSGVRESILEFDEDYKDLSDVEIIALSWFSRLILEANTKSKSVAIIATLVLMSIVAVLALFVF